MNPEPRTQNPELPTLLITLCLLAAYVLPWQSAPFAAMTNHAYDLAEWTSILTRSETPALLTPLLLRLPLACIAIWLGLNAPAGRGYVAAALRVLAVMLIAVALLPPLEFFTIGREDWNYRQQFVLAVGVAIFGLSGVVVGKSLKMPHRASLTVIVLLIAAGAALWGTSRALALMSALRIDVDWELGAPLFAFLCALTIALRLSSLRRQL